jgi:Tol biopolymer transport system component
VLPTFSHDGKYLYFGSRRTGRWELWKQPVAGGRAEQLTTQGGFSAFESADGKSVYYSKGPGVPGIYKLPGEEKVLDSASAPRWGWFPGRHGIYFVDAATNEELPADLRYFDLETKTSRSIGKTTGKPALGGTGITVSPDERWIAFAQVDRAGSDIILVENFR